MFWTILYLIFTHPELLKVFIEIVKLIGPKAAAGLFVQNLTAVKEEVEKDAAPPKNDEESKRLVVRILGRLFHRAGDAAPVFDVKPD